MSSSAMRIPRSPPVFTPGAIFFALDEDDGIVMAIRERDPQRSWAEACQDLRVRSSDAPFGLLYDPEWVRIYRFAGQDIGGTMLFEIPMSELLKVYASREAAQRLAQDRLYLATIIESWMRNISSPLEGRKTPGLDELRELGLAASLEGGSTTLGTVHYF